MAGPKRVCVVRRVPWVRGGQPGVTVAGFLLLR